MTGFFGYDPPLPDSREVASPANRAPCEDLVCPRAAASLRVSCRSSPPSFAHRASQAGKNNIEQNNKERFPQGYLAGGEQVWTASGPWTNIDTRLAPAPVGSRRGPAAPRVAGERRVGLSSAWLATLLPPHTPVRRAARPVVAGGAGGDPVGRRRSLRRWFVIRHDVSV